MKNKEIYAVLKIDRTDKNNIDISFINYFLIKDDAIKRTKELQMQEVLESVEYLVATWKV